MFDSVYQCKKPDKQMIIGGVKHGALASASSVFVHALGCHYNVQSSGIFEE